MNADELANLVVLSVSPQYAERRCQEIVGECFHDVGMSPDRYRAAALERLTPSLHDKLNQMIDLLVEDVNATPERDAEILAAGKLLEKELYTLDADWPEYWMDIYAPMGTPIRDELEQGLETAAKGGL